MRVTQLQVKVLALQLGPIAHADQLQLPLETFADAGHHVVHQGAERPGHGEILVRLPLHPDLAVLPLQADGRVQVQGQVAFRPLHVNLRGADLDIDAAGHGDRVLCYA